MARIIAGVTLCAGFFLSASRSTAADIYISSNIQSAINAAAPGDVIHLAPGRYGEILTINKSLSLVGSGTNCTIYFTPTNYIPLIAINGPATVTLSNFQLTGGWYQSWHTPDDWYFGFSPLGICSTNASLTMNSVEMNRVNNFYVTVTGGCIFATNVALWTEDVDFPCDVGFQLNSCVACFDGLTQDAGHIDHTLNINNPPATFSDVTVLNSRIRASRADYGNCIRTYCNSKLVVTNCYLYRGTDTNEWAMSFASALMHNAVSVNGYSNVVMIAGNTIANLPWAINCYGSVGGDQICIESNAILNSIFGGVSVDWIWYDCVDLGGGPFGSRGGNSFSQALAPSTNYCADVYYSNTSARHPLTHIFALHNTWSNPTNRDAVIRDKLDNPDYGRVIMDELQMNSAGMDAGGRLVISWNERGAGESYTVETATNLGGGWTDAPGAWPIRNPGLGAMSWTNSSTAAPSAFYRIRSAIP